MKIRQIITLAMAMMSSSFFAHGQETIEKIIEEKAKRNIPITQPEFEPLDIEKADVVLDISASGEISIKGESFTVEALKKYLGALVENKQESLAILRCDYDTEFQVLVRTYDLARAAGFKSIQTVIAEEKKLLDDERSLEIPAFKKASDEKVIELSKAKEITIEGKAYTYNSLEKYIAELSKVNKNQSIRIHGDSGTTYDHIVKTIDSCRKGGIWNISFATKKPPTK